MQEKGTAYTDSRQVEPGVPLGNMIPSRLRAGHEPGTASEECRKSYRCTNKETLVPG